MKTFAFACLVSLVLFAGSAGAADLTAETLRAWQEYVELTEQRIAAELEEEEGFLHTDFLPRAEANKVLQRLRDGEVVAEKLETRALDGERIDVPGGMVHHWLGSVFIPGASVEELIAWLQAYDDHYRYFDEVESSRLLSRDGDEFRMFLRLKRKKVVTVHYNTDHLVRYERHGDGRVSSASYATRIAEIADAGTAREKEKPIGSDRGFLWRLNSYWRFQQTRDGVLVELESLSLSRGVPAAVRWIIGRYLDSVPRESIEATLRPIQREAPRGLVTEKKPVGVAVGDNP